MEFTAIDFETASHRRDSACQLAAVKVSGGEIVDSACWLIRPEPFYFTPSNIRIHGITPDRVQDSPRFGEAWAEISRWIVGECLVAHNAAFDIGVLRACLLAHGQPIPELTFTCTRAIARKTWPGRRGYGLKPLSDWLGVRFRHHDALEDSIACAKLLLAAAGDRGVTSVQELEADLRLSRGGAGPWGYRGPGGARRPTVRRSSSGATPSTGMREVSETREERLDVQRLMIRAQFIRPLVGQRIVFTGRLTRLQRDDAEKLAECLGATLQSSVTKQTSLVVVGDPDERTTAAGRQHSVKEQRARALLNQGQTIRICDEEQFLRLLVAESPVDS